MLRRKTLTTIALALCFINMFSQKHINGLLFAPSAERINDRTSLVLFENKPLTLENTFRIDFDFSIWDIKQFGCIFRVINESKQEVSFAFVNFYGEDKIYMDFHSQITHESVQIPITAQDIAEKRWLPVSILFDLKTERAEITLKDSTYVCKPVGLKNPSYIKLAFGLYGFNLDLPEMAIRDIRIKEGEKEISYIPLNEIIGEKVHNKKGIAVGVVKNPKWMTNRHFYWQERVKFESDPATGISYDEKRNSIIVVDKDSSFAYSMRYDKKTPIPLNIFPFIHNSGTTIYDDENDILYIYNLKQEIPDDPTLTIVDMEKFSIIYKYTQIPQLGHYDIWLDKENDDLHIFGGYGEYSYSNKILKYSPDTDNWETLEFTGDEICPRYFSALGQGLHLSQILIMGGIGNESGKREHGGQHLYDLYSVDINTKQIKKLWDINDKVQSDFTPCSNIVFDKNDTTSFYTLCYSQYQENSVLQLYKFNISDGNYVLLGDSIYINTEQIKTSANLFYNKSISEFYAVVKENFDEKNAKVRVYSLASPPITISELSNNTFFYSYLLLPVIAVILLIIIIIWYRKKRRKNIPDISPLPEKDQDTENQTLQPVKEEHEKNAVFILGEFAVFDKNGKDISYYFSPKLRELFAIILLHSCSADRNGISTNMMTSELWTNRDKQSAKNTRGVTINRLRNILEDISGIDLVCQDSNWYFSFGSTFYCDYVEYKKKINSPNKNKTDEDENMSALYNILKRGTLLSNVQESWIDFHKQKHETEILKILWDYLIKLNQANDYAKLIKYSDLYLIIDPLDEDVFKLCMNALQKTGKKSQSILLYSKFVSDYKELMGVEPDMSFVEL